MGPSLPIPPPQACLPSAPPRLGAGVPAGAPRTITDASTILRRMGVPTRAPSSSPQAESVAWRLLQALVVSRHEDITSEDSSLWASLNRVLDDALDSRDIRPLTASLAVDLGSLTDRASRHIQTGLTEQTRSGACVLLREVKDRLRLDTQDIGLLRRLAWLTEQVADEVLDLPSSGATPAPAAACPSAPPSVPARWAGPWSMEPAPATLPAASA